MRAFLLLTSAASNSFPNARSAANMRPMNALWAEEKNTGDSATLKAIIESCGLDADAVMKAGEAPEMAGKREAYTRHAIEQSVFGAPFFVIDGERFWGQDRLDFVERKLAA